MKKVVNSLIHGCVFFILLEYLHLDRFLYYYLYDFCCTIINSSEIYFTYLNIFLSFSVFVGSIFSFFTQSLIVNRQSVLSYFTLAPLFFISFFAYPVFAMVLGFKRRPGIGAETLIFMFILAFLGPLITWLSFYIGKKLAQLNAFILK